MNISNESIDSGDMIKFSIIMIFLFFAAAPIIHLETGTDLIPLVASVLAVYLFTTVLVGRIVEGVVAGILVLATTSADYPILISETRSADLVLFIVDPFIGLFLVITAGWWYMGDLEVRPRIPLLGIASLWAGWAGVAAIFGGGPAPDMAAYFAIQQVRWVVYLLAGLIIISIITLRAAIVSLGLAGVAHATFGVVQSINRVPIGLSYLGERTYPYPETSTFFGIELGHANYIGGLAGDSRSLAAITLLAFAVCLLYLLRGRIWQRIVAIVGLVPILFTIMVSSSDTAIICTIVTIGLVPLYLLVQRFPSIQQALRRYRIAIASLFGIGTILSTIIAWNIGIGYLVGTYVPGADGASLGPRIEQWTAAIRMVRDYPIFGVGGANFEILSTQYGTSETWAAHSVFFEFLADTGIVGLLIYLSLLSAIGYYTIQAFNTGNDQDMVAIIVIWMITFTLLSSMDQLWDSQAPYSVFYLVSGMVAAHEIERSRISK